jgi:intein/homing endonuclease
LKQGDISFNLTDNFLSKFKGKQPKWGPLGYFTYKRCVTVDTPILTADMRWIPAKEAVEGTKIIAFEEEGSYNSLGRLQPRKMKDGVITHHSIEKADCVEITLSNGEILKCTPDHSWLVKVGEDNRLRWVEAQDLLSCDKRFTEDKSLDCYMVKYANVSKPETGYEAC